MISIDSTAMKTNNFDLANLSQTDTALEIRNLDLRYGSKQALFNVSMKIPKKQVTAFIGLVVVVSQHYCAVLIA